MLSRTQLNRFSRTKQICLLFTPSHVFSLFLFVDSSPFHKSHNPRAIPQPIVDKHTTQSTCANRYHFIFTAGPFPFKVSRDYLYLGSILLELIFKQSKHNLTKNIYNKQTLGRLESCLLYTSRCV